MRDTSRHIILLIAVLSFLTSSYIVVNSAEDPKKNTQEVERNLDNNNTENSNKSKTEPALKISDQSSLIGKSLSGIKMMISDLDGAMSFF